MKAEESAVGKDFTYDEGMLLGSLNRIQELEARTAKNSYDLGYQDGYNVAKKEYEKTL